MFYGIVQGKKRRFLGGEHDGRRLVEIWLGDRKIWPSGNVASRIRVQLPVRGSEDWVYWVHALDSLERGNASSTNYLRFTIDGLSYYLQKAPDGTVPYVVDGDYLELMVEGDGVPMDSLGDSLVVQARIPQRTHYLFSGSIMNASRTVDMELPVLAGSVLKYAQACAGRGNVSTSYMTVRSKPSDEVLLNSSLMKQSRTWHTYSYGLKASPLGDSGWQCVARVSGSGWVRAPYVVYPKFDRSFNLKITSVE